LGLCSLACFEAYIVSKHLEFQCKDQTLQLAASSSFVVMKLFPTSRQHERNQVSSTFCDDIWLTVPPRDDDDDDKSQQSASGSSFSFQFSDGPSRKCVFEAVDNGVVMFANHVTEIQPYHLPFMTNIWNAFRDLADKKILKTKLWIGRMTKFVINTNIELSARTSVLSIGCRSYLSLHEHESVRMDNETSEKFEQAAACAGMTMDLHGKFHPPISYKGFYIEHENNFPKSEFLYPFRKGYIVVLKNPLLNICAGLEMPIYDDQHFESLFGDENSSASSLSVLRSSNRRDPIPYDAFLPRLMPSRRTTCRPTPKVQNQQMWYGKPPGFTSKPFKPTKWVKNIDSCVK